MGVNLMVTDGSFISSSGKLKGKRMGKAERYNAKDKEKKPDRSVSSSTVSDNQE